MPARLFDHGMDAKWVNEEYIDKEQLTPNINTLKKQQQ